MVFAAQKLASRHGRGAVFRSRGRERTETDFAQYWKRKKEKPEDFSPLFQDGFWKLEGIHDPNLQNLARMDILSCTGSVLAERGQITDALKSFNEVLLILESMYPGSTALRDPI